MIHIRMHVPLRKCMAFPAFVIQGKKTESIFLRFKGSTDRGHFVPTLFRCLRKHGTRKLQNPQASRRFNPFGAKALREESCLSLLCPWLQMHMDNTTNRTIASATTWVIMCSVNLHNIESSSQKVIHFFKNWKENKYGAVKLLSRGIYLDISQNISLC